MADTKQNTFEKLLKNFWENHNDYNLKTELLSVNGLTVFKATLADGHGEVVVTAHSDHVPGSESFQPYEQQAIQRAIEMHTVRWDGIQASRQQSKS